MIGHIWQNNSAKYPLLLHEASEAVNFRLSSINPLNMVNVENKTTPSLKYGNTLFLLVSILPAASLVFLIVKYWINVPYWDDWDYAFLFENFHNKALGFADFFSQHNESREIFPKYIVLLFGLFTKWDVRVYMAFTYLLLCSMSFFVYRLLSKTDNGSAVKKYILFFLINLLLFSPAHWKNLLWSTQFKCFIPGALLFAGLLINLSGISLGKKLLYGGSLAFFSTFSFANGILLWIFLLPFNVLREESVLKDRYKVIRSLAVYGLIFATVVCLYFYGYRKPSGHPSFLSAFEDIPNALKFFLVYFSTPVFSVVSPGPQAAAMPRYLLNTSFTIGAVLVTTYAAGLIYIVKRFSFKKIFSPGYYPWIMAGAYSIATGLLTTLGRAGFGWWKAAPSKYAIFSLFLPIALIPLIPNIYSCLTVSIKISRKKLISIMQVVFIVFFECFYIFTYIRSVGYMKREKLLREKGRQSLRFNAFVEQKGDVEILYPDIDLLNKRYLTLNKMGYLDFQPFDFSEFQISGDVDAGSKLTVCRLVPNKRLVVAGWARDPVTDKPAEDVILIAFNKDDHIVPVATVTTGIYSGHAAEAMEQHADPDYMFYSLPYIGNLPPGNSTIRAFIVDDINKLLIPIAGEHEVRNGKPEQPPL